MLSCATEYDGASDEFFLTSQAVILRGASYAAHSLYRRLAVAPGDASRHFSLPRPAGCSTLRHFPDLRCAPPGLLAQMLLSRARADTLAARIAQARILADGKPRRRRVEPGSDGCVSHIHPPLASRANQLAIDRCGPRLYAAALVPSARGISKVSPPRRVGAGTAEFLGPPVAQTRISDAVCVSASTGHRFSGILKEHERTPPFSS
jgi:hypothetical protein